jgi:DNA-binding NtrC family response regulator
MRLSSEDRSFFRLVIESVTCNPFSAERVEFDRRIVGGTTCLVGEPLVDLVIEKVLERLAQLRGELKADLSAYSGEDRDLLQEVLMFEVYYRFANEFDLLIRNQAESGDQPCKVSFARDALSQLCQCGCSEAEALRYFAFFYQLRRTFYFIHHSLIGQSHSVQTLRCQLWNAVFTTNIRWYERFLWNRMEDFSTLILGETGTGKGTAAAAIGRSGFIPFDAKHGVFVESFTRNFIGINLSQFPEPLIESELFGHKKGSFTGAIDDHMGLFALCTPHGSVFLDEIGDAPVPVQIKLLQVLQERTFSPLGCRDSKRFSGRVIAATNKPLLELGRQGKFREDFFYRLCSNVITMPTLRLRFQEDSGELDLLIQAIVQRTLGEPLPDIVKGIKATLKRDLPPGYHWPGNVRELEQAVRRIILCGEYPGNIFTCPGRNNLANLLFRGMEDGSLSAARLSEGYCMLLYQPHGTFEEVSRRTGLDRRTVKKYIQGVESWSPGELAP